jgi:HK97 family phage major capsid protein
MKNKQLFAGLLMLVAIILVAVTFAPGAAILAAAPLAGLISSAKMKEQRTGFENELLSIINKAKEEKRDFSPEEVTKRSELINKIETLDNEITLRIREEAIEARVAGQVINQENAKQEEKELKRFSILRGINSIITKGQLEGFEAEMHQEAQNEMRSAGITSQGMFSVPYRLLAQGRSAKREAEKRTTLLAGSSSGSYLVQTEVEGFIDALLAKSVLTQLGAQMITGLTGNISIPKSGGASAAWEGEVDANADGTPTISPVTASPKRLGAYGLFSKQLIQQAGNYDVEKLVQNDIVNAINAAVQAAAIEGGGAGEPTGILANASIGSVVGGTNGAAPGISHIIDLEKAVAVANADVNSLAYLTNPKVRAALKKSPLDAGSGQMVWDLKSNNELMGYKAGVTTAVPSDLTKGEGTGLSAIIFGNFNDLLLMQWGGFDIVVNPYTNAKTNQMEIVINSFWDVVLRNAVSFAAMEDAIA